MGKDVRAVMNLLLPENEEISDQSKCLLNFKLINDRLNKLSDVELEVTKISKEILEMTIEFENLDKYNVKRDELINKQMTYIHDILNEFETLKSLEKNLDETIKKYNELDKKIYHYEKKIMEHEESIKLIKTDSSITTSSIFKSIISMIVSAIVGAILALVIKN